MDATNFISITGLVVSGLAAIISIISSIVKTSTSNKIKITNKETGKSVIINTNNVETSHREYRKILELVK